MADIALLGVIVVVAFMVSEEGAWGAATTLVATLLAAILATSYFESLAISLQGVLTGSDWRMRVDLMAFLGLFGLLVFLFRFAGEKLQETDLQVEAKAYDAVRWGCGLGTGYVVACVMAVALHLAPAPRTYFDFVPEQPRLFGIASPDYNWLGYMHRLSRGPYATSSGGQPVVFDGDYYRVSRSQPPQHYPDLPLRYAHRRELYASGVAPAQRSGAPAGIPQPGQRMGGKAF